MIYKFKYKPNFKVNSKVTGREVFRFNRKGEYITDDEEIIERAKGHFDYQKLDVSFNDAVDLDKLREEAKEAGISSWHLKNADTLLKELGR